MNSYFRYNFNITQTHNSKKSKYGSKYRHLSALAQFLDIDLIKLLHNIFVAYKKNIAYARDSPTLSRHLSYVTFCYQRVAY